MKQANRIVEEALAEPETVEGLTRRLELATKAKHIATRKGQKRIAGIARNLQAETYLRLTALRKKTTAPA